MRKRERNHGRTENARSRECEEAEKRANSVGGARGLPAGTTVAEQPCSTICLATEFTKFRLSRLAWRAGPDNGGGRQSRVGSFELFLFVLRSCGG
ncbi:hypothetical protein EVAR_3821_1 [Eumeta japonica]|uniref:Uncharacterized protein n=1 Tax=Eumeta variegata TaxID=151549 RepID=A0A4C1SUQ8_EUMVA|nr:hypothetical protein EVAR_3821_1 [Eumeta japonica]